MQRAEFRIVLRDASQHALAWRLTMRGEDIYAGPPRSTRGDELRQSYHASGFSHIHLWGATLPPGAPLPPPGTITDRVKVASWSVTPVTWGYSLKPDTAKRRTLALEPAAHEVPVESWDVTLFVIGAARPDLVEQTVAEQRALGQALGVLRADWTTPQLLAVVSTFSIEDFRFYLSRTKR
jgi:hypothetical protein